MEHQLYLKMLRTFIKGKINLNGIILTPSQIIEALGEGYVVFTMKNPDKSSYTKVSLKGQLDEELMVFNNIIGLGNKLLFPSRIANSEEIYTGDDINDYIKSTLSSITKLRTDNYSDEDSGKRVYNIITVKHKDVEYGMDDDFVQILNKVIPIKAAQYLSGNDTLVGEIPLDYAIEIYHNWQRHSRYDETDVNYSQFDEFISDPKFMNYIDTEWQSLYVRTIFQ